MKKSWIFLALAGVALLYFLRLKDSATAAPSHPVIPSEPTPVPLPWPAPPDRIYTPPVVPAPPVYVAPSPIPSLPGVSVPAPVPQLPANVVGQDAYYVLLDQIRAAAAFWGNGGGTTAEVATIVRTTERYWGLYPAPAIAVGTYPNYQSM